MKYYFSSFNIGNKGTSLAHLASPNNKIGYISNARDFVGVDIDRLKKRTDDEILELESLGLEIVQLDLKKYFYKQSQLEFEISKLGGLWVCGGNVFVLRQAYKLSGLDNILTKYLNNNEFLYSGYSAGICVLCEDLKPYALIDDEFNFPYKELNYNIYQGLGFLNFLVLPHFKSNHPESHLVDKCVDYCIEKKLSFLTMKDGQVIIL